MLDCETFKTDAANGTRISVVFSTLQNNFREVIQLFNQLIIQYSSIAFSIEYSVQQEETYKRYAPQMMAARIQ